MRFSHILVLILAIVPLAAAEDYTWTNDGGDGDRSWTDPDNWTTEGDSPAYPSSQYDTATIPQLAGERTDYPIFDSAEITIGALTITGTVAGNVHELTFASNDTTPRRLIIAGRDGLKLTGNDSTILLQKNSRLQLDGGGIADIEGAVVFDNGGSAPPRFVVGDGSTLTVVNSSTNGTFRGVTKGLITGEKATENDLPEVLVLASTAVMIGSFDIDLLFVNNGQIYTELNDQPGTINLVCQAKTGRGIWDVDGGTSQTLSNLVVTAPWFSSGPVYVHKNGWLEVERHMSIIAGYSYANYRRFRLDEGGTVRVSANVVFDAARWPYQCLPD